VNTFSDDRGAVADVLTAAGVECVTLDRGLAPPLVLVGIPSGTGRTPARGLWETTLPITVVGNAPGDTINADWMLDQLQAVLIALGPAPFRPITYGDDQRPAIQLTYTRSVSNPTC
jgi:hypothetical protein